MSMLADFNNLATTEKSPSGYQASPLFPKIERSRTPLANRTYNSKGMVKVHNKLFIIKALEQYLLPGPNWEVERSEIEEKVEQCGKGHFILLLKSIRGKMMYGGVYVVDSSQKIFKVHSFYNTPFTITSNMVNQYLRFNSALELDEFVGTSEFHTLVDAIILRNSSWSCIRSNVRSPVPQGKSLNIVSYKQKVESSNNLVQLS